MRIALINPSALMLSGRDLNSGHLIGPLVQMRPFGVMAQGMPLALPTLAAHTPPGHEIAIIDEEIEPIPFDTPFDLVGITAMTFKATRAYEIAAEFRKRGVPVVMGGIHATVCPDEVARHVDCVVIGEAEELWPKLIQDVMQKRLQPRYQADAFPDLKTSRVPRYDLVKNQHYLYTYLQTTRGCPFNCNFCTVTRANGHKVRKKSVAQIMAELDYVIGLRMKPRLPLYDEKRGRIVTYVGTIAFIDDNFAIDRSHALEVIRAFTAYQKAHDLVFLWYTQVNYSVGFDEELLKAMQESNCRQLFIGFESLNPETLKGMRKKMNSPAQYAQAIDNINAHGMHVVFSTIIGDANTTPASVEALADFVEQKHVIHVLPNILTPYPGSELRATMDAQNQIFLHDPVHYNIRTVVFHPSQMSAIELQALYTKLCQRLFTYRRQWVRARKWLNQPDTLIMPWYLRIGYAAFIPLCLLALLAQKRIRLSVAGHLMLFFPLSILRTGRVICMEIFSTAADYDDYVQHETRRFKEVFRSKDMLNRSAPSTTSPPE